MGNKGGKKSIKKVAVSRKTKILRKDTKWTVKAKAGGHKAKESVPLIILIRDYLKYAGNATEARKTIKQKKVLVDGKAVTEPKHPVGFMDVITIKPKKEHYRTILDKKGRIILQPIKEQESKYKLCRIEKITKIKKNKTQLNLHDGRNKIVKEENYKVGDVVKITLPKQEIKEHYPLTKGSLAYIIGGKHSGETGKVNSVNPGTIRKKRQIEITEKDKQFLTPMSYVFILGKDKASISIK